MGTDIKEGKMKKYILLILLLLLSFALTGCEEVRYPNTPQFKLYIFNGYISITGFNDDYCTEDLVIEEQVTFYCEQHKRNETGYVSNVHDNAFQNKGLKSVMICDSENSKFDNILSYAFADNPDLVEVILPHTIFTITDFAFANNPSLETIDLHNVWYLYDGVFLNNTSLQLIRIGNEIKKIGNNAFENCHDDLTIIIGNMTPPKIGSDIFKGVDNYRILVPRIVLEDYKSARGWSNFSSHIFAQEDN